MKIKTKQRSNIIKINVVCDGEKCERVVDKSVTTTKMALVVRTDNNTGKNYIDDYRMTCTRDRKSVV